MIPHPTPSISHATARPTARPTALSKTRVAAPCAVAPRSTQSTRRGFSITELLVVIGIIVLLIGILLPALGAAQQRARKTQTVSTMTGFAQACESYFAQFGVYPGVVPERVLAADPQISGMENALLALMGGYVREEDVGSVDFNNTTLFPPADGWELITFNGPDGNYRIRVNSFAIGTGPVIGGKQFAPFFSPRPSDLAATRGQGLTDPNNLDDFAADALQLPDLLDGWGTPIIYMRALREVGPLVGPTGTNPIYQFDRRTMDPYLVSRRLGDRGGDQGNSIMNPGFAAADVVNAIVAQSIRHAGIGTPNQPLDSAARGKFVLISAGRDNVFFSRFDGPGTLANPITTGNVDDEIIQQGALIFDEFDDIRVFGGG